MSKTKQFRSPQTLKMAREIESREGRVVLPRCAQQAQARRREQIKEYLKRGVPKTVMAELLGVSTKTIHDDINAIQEGLGRKVAAIKGNPQKTYEEVGMIADRLRAITDAAMAEYVLSRTPTAKNLFLNTAAKAEWIRARVYMETGVLPRAGEEIRVTNNTQVTLSARFGQEFGPMDEAASRRKIMSAIEAVLGQVPEEPRLIDATPTSEQPA